MFALLWFQEYSGIRPTTRTIISVRIQDFWLVLWGLFVRVVASRARVFRWFIFFSFAWLSITIFWQNMANMTGHGHGNQHKWALTMVANGVILRYASNSKEQPNLVFSARIGTLETVGIIRFLGFLLFHSVFWFLPDSLRMLLSLASVF